MLKFLSTPLQGSYIVEPDLKGDERGSFFRVYCKDEFSSIGHHVEWVQMNHSQTNNKGTIRGMHYQTGGFKEIKLVKCILGSVFDVIVDLRKGSPTYLNWFGVEISSKNHRMVYIPEGFAHGFQTLENNSQLIYLHSNYYTPQSEGGLNYADEALHIKWPLPLTQISVRDQSHPFINSSFKGL